MMCSLIHVRNSAPDIGTPLRILVFLAALGWLFVATFILVILPRSLPWYDKCYVSHFTLYLRVI